MGLSRQTVKFAGLLIFIVICLVLFRWTDLGRYLHPEQIRDSIQSVGYLAPLLYVLIYSVAPVFFVPGWIITIGGGLAFGPLWGTILTVMGATIGATLAFLVGRYLGRDFVTRLLKEKFKTIGLLDERAASRGFEVIFFLRLIPLIPFNALDYMAGISKIGTRDYILGTFLGIIPGTFAYVYLGSTLTHIRSWGFTLAIGLLILLSLIPIFYKRRKKRDHSLK
ncbi:MAG TPA: TVP38/TMEM64 family protein [Nitrospiria bacterium]|nr:TVP38/TMEM64 family protein [Nitrospiria bacterium]